MLGIDLSIKAANISAFAQNRSDKSGQKSNYSDPRQARIPEVY
jgi:hypothetical protein